MREFYFLCSWNTTQAHHFELIDVEQHSTSSRINQRLVEIIKHLRRIPPAILHAKTFTHWCPTQSPTIQRRLTSLTRLPSQGPWPECSNSKSIHHPSLRSTRMGRSSTTWRLSFPRHQTTARHNEMSIRRLLWIMTVILLRTRPRDTITRGW